MSVTKQFSKARSSKRSAKSGRKSAENSASRTRPIPLPPHIRGESRAAYAKRRAAYEARLAADVAAGFEDARKRRAAYEARLAADVAAGFEKNRECRQAGADGERVIAHINADSVRAHYEGMEREVREGITLKGARLDQARRTLSDVNESAAAVHQLAASAICAGDQTERDAYLVAIQNAALLSCRRLDLIDGLLGNGRGSFGNFADAFEPLTEEHAAGLDQTEAK